MLKQIHPRCKCLLVFMGALGCSATTQTPHRSSASSAEAISKKESQGKVDMSRPEQIEIAKDIENRLHKFAPIDIDFEEKLVAAPERQVLKKLVAAAQILDDIYFDQVSAHNQKLRETLHQGTISKAALNYFEVMYGPWDRLKGDEPFIGKQEKPLGAGFYPEDITRQELEAWIKTHPEDEKPFRDYFTVIERQGPSLKAVPYAIAYAERLKKAASLLEEAAALSPHPALKNYLKLRAQAFLSNDYFKSDLAWMDLGDSPLEVVLGPYEVYEDRLMGYKASFEVYLTLHDPDYSARLQKLAKYNAQVERNLPLAKKHFTKRGTDSPISVVIELFTAGSANAGIQSAAFNLPNDERVRAQKGSKKVMLKNVIEAKYHKVLVPIGERLVDPALTPLIEFDPYFTEILLHEIAHGMGPGQIKVNGRKTSVNRELKELYTAIEECKADIVGLHNGAYLIKLGALPKTMKRQLPATYVAGVFRAVRFGTEEAHAKAVLIGFNYLLKKGAVTYDAKNERYGVDYHRFDKEVQNLAQELLLIEAEGNYKGAKQLLETYGVASKEMKHALSKLGDIPVDIRPHYTILEKMQRW